MGLDFLALAYMYEILAYAVGRVLPVRHRRPQLGQRHHPGQVRHRGAEAQVAAAAHRRDHAVRLLDDRAGQRRIGSPLHPDRGGPRR